MSNGLLEKARANDQTAAFSVLPKEVLLLSEMIAQGLLGVSGLFFKVRTEVLSESYLRLRNLTEVLHPVITVDVLRDAGANDFLLFKVSPSAIVTNVSSL